MPNISEYTRPIFTKFADLVGVWVGMINLSVLRLPKARFFGNQLILRPFADVAMNDLCSGWNSVTHLTIEKPL